MIRFIKFLLLAAMALPCSSLIAQSQDSPRLILDADTANEIDDLFAIVRVLRQSEYDLVGLSSAQWIHYLGERESVQASQQDNEDLLQLMGRTDLPAPQGSDEPMGKPWGGEDPKDSPAAQFIIKHAMATPDGSQLRVVCLGASTNLASAIKLAPEIVPRIKAYVLGFQYDSDRAVWNKSEFNIRRDLNAADFLLNCDGLELHVMPTSVSGQFKFDQDDTFRRLEGMGQLGKFLTDKWKTKFGDSKRWTMWDVALVEAIIDPDLASESQVMTPPENTQRKVWMYSAIEVRAMFDDYWAAVTNAK